MKPRTMFLMCCVWGPSLWPSEPAQPEDFAFWLEQLPGSTSVLVNASWALDGIQGYSLGVCHDPAEATLGPSDTRLYGLCEEDYAADCPAVECTYDLAHSPCGGPPDFVSVEIHDNGVTLGVALLCTAAVTYPATDRIELLKLTYSPLGPSAALEFCESLGNPPVVNCVIRSGIQYRPATQEGIVADFGPAYARGDANADGAIDIADPVFLFQYLFRGASQPTCRRACDANADGCLNVADVVTLLGYLFRSCGPLPEPRACGRAAVRAPGLDCEAFEPCR